MNRPTSDGFPTPEDPGNGAGNRSNHAPNADDDGNGEEGTGNGPDGLGEALTQALARRAAAVRVEPSMAARARVDQRLRRRARRRQTRRTALAAVVLVALAASGVRLLDGGSTDDEVDVATEGPTAADPVVPVPRLELGQTGADPGDFGLPRIILDPATDVSLNPIDRPEELVVVKQLGLSETGYTQLQFLQPEGSLFPLIVAPWNPSAAELALPTPGEGDTVAVDVNGITAALEGQAPGWLELTWPMADGTKAYLYSYGVSAETLLHVAAGMSRPEPERPGYQFATLPTGYRAATSTAPAPDDLKADYTLTWTDGPRPVTLVVGSGSREQFEEIAINVLGRAVHAEATTVMGEPAMIAREDNGGWTVMWSPAPGVGAGFHVAGEATRDQVDALVGALDEVDAATWAEAVTG